MRFWTGLEWRPLSPNEAAYRRDQGADIIDDDALDSPPPGEKKAKPVEKPVEKPASDKTPPGQQVAAGVVPNASTIAPGKTK